MPRSDSSSQASLSPALWLHLRRQPSFSPAVSFAPGSPRLVPSSPRAPVSVGRIPQPSADVRGPRRRGAGLLRADAPRPPALAAFPRPGGKRRPSPRVGALPLCTPAPEPRRADPRPCAHHTASRVAAAPGSLSLPESSEAVPFVVMHPLHPVSEGSVASPPLTVWHLAPSTHCLDALSCLSFAPLTGPRRVRLSPASLFGAVCSVIPALCDPLPLGSGFATVLWAAPACPSTCFLVFGLVSPHFREWFLLILFPLASVVRVLMPGPKAWAAALWCKCRK